MSKRGRSGWVKDGVGFIPLSRGLVAIVDEDMVPFLEKRKWHATCAKKPYAARTIGSKPCQSVVFMHRVVIGDVPEGMEIDHINGNGLDNRRSNLAVVSHAENMRKAVYRSTNKSGVPGVSRHICGKWSAQITRLGRRYWLGLHVDTESAAAAREQFMRIFDRQMEVSE